MSQRQIVRACGPAWEQPGGGSRIRAAGVPGARGQEAAPDRRTVFVSTHLITEFEGLIDEFTILDGGRDVLTLEADEARERYRKIYARFAEEPAGLELPGAQTIRRRGRELELVASADPSGLIDRLRARSPEALVAEPLTLEEIVVCTLQSGAAA